MRRLALPWFTSALALALLLAPTTAALAQPPAPVQEAPPAEPAAPAERQPAAPAQTEPAALAEPQPAAPVEAPPSTPVEAAAPPGVTSGSGTDEALGGKKKKKKKKELGAEACPEAVSDEQRLALAAGSATFEFRGRVQVLADYEKQTIHNAIAGTNSDEESVDFELASARAGVKVRMLETLTLVLEGEFGGGGVEVRDAYVQWKSKRLLIRAGNFKMPLSAFTLESPWTLPLARRGNLHEHLADNLTLFGRRVGVMAQLKGGGSLDPALVIGAFESVYWASDPDASPRIDRGDALRQAEFGEQTLIGRLSVTPGFAEVAAVGQLQRSRVPVPRTDATTRWLVGAEATVDLEREATGLRVWAEAYYGTSLYDREFASLDLSKVSFATGRVLVAYRFGGLSRGERYAEPFVAAGALDPDTGLTKDLYWETVVGVNLGHWRHSRLTLQYEHGDAKPHFNTSGQYGLGYRNGTDVRTHRAVVLEAGAAF